MSLDPIRTLFATTSSAKASQALSQLMGSGGDFMSTFESLLAASRNGNLSRNDSRLALVTAQSKLQQQTVLFNAFSGAYSTKNFGFGMLGGLSGLTSLPAWAYDVQRVMNDSQIDSLFDLQRQMAYLTATRLTSSSSDLGVFSSLV